LRRLTAEHDGDFPRPNSCSSAPCKFVECLFKRAVHACRIIQGQDLPPPRLERGGRRTAAARGDIESPTEMLAGMTESDAQPVMRADLAIERADVVMLTVERRYRLGDTGLELSSDLARQPGLPLRSAAD